MYFIGQNYLDLGSKLFGSTQNKKFIIINQILFDLTNF